ncbi:MAG: hypothetical protein KDD53_12865, partial [Bdellovibrionales bacterium]|nr:hypothetical protein [Bdellovibrionales bacterium]
MSGPVLTDPIVIDPNKVEIDPNDPSTNSISGKLVTPTFRDTLGTVEPTIDPIEELPPGHQNAYLESTPLE